MCAVLILIDAPVDFDQISAILAPRPNLPLACRIPYFEPLNTLDTFGSSISTSSSCDKKWSTVWIRIPIKLEGGLGSFVNGHGELPTQVLS